MSGVFLQKEKPKNKVKLTNLRYKFHECENHFKLAVTVQQ